MGSLRFVKLFLHSLFFLCNLAGYSIWIHFIDICVSLLNSCAKGSNLRKVFGLHLQIWFNKLFDFFLQLTVSDAIRNGITRPTRREQNRADQQQTYST